jgi:signal transduction histidine kinase
VAVNAAMERNVRLTRDVLLGRVFWDVFPATVGTEYERHYRAAATEGRTAHFTDAYDDGRLALTSEADVYPAPGGGVAVFWRDVTARVRAEAERAGLLAAAEEARATAEAANRAKGEFLAVMSHELRTPLNAIGGYAELIELGIHGPVTEAQRTALARIQASQRHLLGLIAGVLDYSRVEAGAATYRLADVPVGDAVAEAEVLVAPQLRARGLGYGWSGAPPGLCVRADREKLQQILLNLLGNAVKFTDARGGVPGRVEVACTVEVGDGGAAPGGGRVHLAVRDTGDGIAAEQLDRIFEPFVQADQRLTRAHAGVGLGLAISRDLARGMGGDLTAESTPGVGSTFTLTLPAAGLPAS